MSGKVVSVNTSEKRGEKKTPVDSIEIKVDHGIVGDSHGGHHSVREISLLAIESHRKMIEKGVDVSPGDFAENITTEGIDLPSLPIGTRLRIGNIEAEVTQIGKTCHDRCNIYQQVGDCVMPREGIFVKSINPGTISPGDEITIL
ncbi:MOSC domain-containing protein [bacterium]